MEVQLTADQRGFIRQAIETGAVGAAEASLASGQARIVTERSMRDLAAEVKQRGRGRLVPGLFR